MQAAGVPAVENMKMDNVPDIIHDNILLKLNAKSKILS